MNSRTLRNRYVTGLAVLALTAFVQLGTDWMQPAKARAQLGDGSVRFISESISILGIVPGQNLRISVGTKPGSHVVPKLWFFTRVAQQPNNEVLFESERIEVPPGEWRFTDISRDALNIEGELGTRRAQVMVRVFIQAPRGTESSDLIGSLEVVDEGTGQTVLLVPHSDILISSTSTGGRRPR